LYDADDIERLGFIKGLRDDAGFSLAEIGQMLEDEAARTRNRARFRSTTDAAERRAIVDDALARVERQIASLRDKRDRLTEMIAEAEARRGHLRGHIAELDAGLEPQPHDHAAPAGARADARSTGTARSARTAR
ncbi:MAG: MerR family DNA-binding protein, partial [Chloroflexota bacterium]